MILKEFNNIDEATNYYYTMKKAYWENKVTIFVKVSGVVEK